MVKGLETKDAGECSGSPKVSVVGGSIVTPW